jgi:hypothetical protein
MLTSVHVHYDIQLRLLLSQFGRWDSYWIEWGLSDWAIIFILFVKTFISNVNFYRFLFSYLSRDGICMYLCNTGYKLPTSTPQYMRPPCQSTTVLTLLKPIYFISLGWWQRTPLVHKGLLVSPWVQGVLVSGYCPYTLWYILRTSTCPTHLGITQNKTINSFVGRLQGIQTVKISEAMTLRPAVDFSCMNLLLYVLWWQGPKQRVYCPLLSSVAYDGFQHLVTEAA